MSTKTYTVRIPANAPEVKSDQVAQWLEAYVASPADLVTDPGAGERSLRLSLDRERVEQGAHAADEAEATFLRRLVATNIPVPKEEKQEPVEHEAPRPKAMVLKGPLRLRPEQLSPLVDVFDAGQSYALRQVFHVPPIPAALQAAAYTQEEREQLSVAACEVVNRRAPRALVENIDVFGLVTTLVAIESRKIEQVQAVAERLKEQQAQRAAEEPIRQQAQARQGSTL
jgi:hypothetical protein